MSLSSVWIRRIPEVTRGILYSFLYAAGETVNSGIHTPKVYVHDFLVLDAQSSNP